MGLTTNRRRDRLAVLPQPLQVGIFHTCPRCSKWFALRRASVRHDKLVGQVSTYRCRRCQAEVEFASHLPSRAI